MVGKVMLEAYDPKGGAVRVTFYAGGTELSVEAKQAETITPTIAKFNFLI